jgi:Glyoxalase/Bleomycin resistance protein/Dioxygenase superfamily
VRTYRGASRYLRRVEVKGIRWLGVGTERVSRMRSFAIDVLGFQVEGEDTEYFVELAMGDGAKLELFGPAAVADSPWLFESNPVVAGFLVDDIEAARDELARTPDVELLGELRVLPGGYAWQHFRAPDGHVYELTADPGATR